MLRLLLKCIKNKKGSILVETIVGVAIYAMIMIAFAAILANASTLFLRAQVGAREWERIFIKMENKDYSAAVTQSSEFNLVLKAKEMEYSNIILADGEKYSTTGEVSLSSVPSTMLVKSQVFRRYEETVEHYATPHSSNKVYVYTIENK